jgi:hypothetical protein
MLKEAQVHRAWPGRGLPGDDAPKRFEFFVSFVADDPEELEEIGVVVDHRQLLQPQLKPKLLRKRWVIFGTLAEAREKAPAAWGKIKGDKNRRLRDIDYYPNNYQKDSRACIEQGHFTP